MANKECTHGNVKDFECQDCGERVAYCLGCDRTIFESEAYMGPSGRSVLCEKCYAEWRKDEDEKKQNDVINSDEGELQAEYERQLETEASADRLKRSQASEAG